MIRFQKFKIFNVSVSRIQSTSSLQVLYIFAPMPFLIFVPEQLSFYSVHAELISPSSINPWLIVHSSCRSQLTFFFLIKFVVCLSLQLEQKFLKSSNHSIHLNNSHTRTIPGSIYSSMDSLTIKFSTSSHWDKSKIYLVMRLIQ